MSFTFRLLLALCVFAGMANGMVHKDSHDTHDECAAQHSHDDGDGGTKDALHHHDCCHFPSAECMMEGIFADITFQTILVEISADVSLVQDEPVFALEKPPLI